MSRTPPRSGSPLPASLQVRDLEVLSALDPEHTGFITPQNLRSVLRKKGLHLTDPRLKGTMARIRALDKITMENLADMLQQDMLLSNALEGRLIVANFEDFSADVESIFKKVEPNKDGGVATYIPQLARVDPDQFAVAFCSIDGQRLAFGDYQTDFCIQSCSKPINYCIALELHGEKKVHSHVGQEPSGRNFNEMALNDQKLPHNPMINSGAIMSISLIKPELPLAERFGYIMDVWQKLCGGKEAGFDNAVYLSERATASRNFCLGYMMKEAKAFPDNTDLLKTLELYFMGCSIDVTAEGMAMAAATLANGGVCPITGERVFKPETVKNCLSLMYSCGMYDFSGEFAFTMGFPAKSGVAGALMIVIPGVGGFCTWSPRLDKLGNSVRGVEFCRHLSKMYAFHNFDLYFPSGSASKDGSGQVAYKKDPRRKPQLSTDGKILSMLFASAAGELIKMQHLIARGVKVNIWDYDNRTPLHLAASNGHYNIVEYLLCHGADPEIRDIHNNTAEDDAQRGGYSKIVELLQKWSGEESKFDESVTDPEYACFHSLDTDNTGTVFSKDLFEPLKRAGMYDEKRILEALDVEEVDEIPADFEYEQHFLPLVTSLPNILKAIQGSLAVSNFEEFSDYLVRVFDEVKENRSGDVARYIPQLANVDPEKFGVSVCTVDCQRFNYGDTSDYFTAQSCSKPITYCMAQELLGESKVHQHVGREASGRSFNDLALDHNRRPHNPMINAGAIMTCSLVKNSQELSERYEYITSVWKKLAGNEKPHFSNQTYLSELDTADRNFCLAYMMQEAEAFPENVDLEDTLKLYFQCCSISVNCEKMSVVAATLANNGVCPITGERVFKPETVRNCLSLMFSCGMYDYSGQFAFRIGVPAKSGVSGVMMVVIPGIMGIATWSPRLDKLGNSARGVEFCKKLVTKYNLHNFGRLTNADASLGINPFADSSHEQAIHLADAMFAANSGDRRALARLAARGENLANGDYDARTPLHLAASKGHYYAVEYLLSIGINPNVVDRWGFSPLDEARRGNHTKVINLLVSKGAKDPLASASSE